MSIDFIPADYSPNLSSYTGQGAFRFWCQKVLPIVYDDSLSYYELLNKVVYYLNNVISDVASVENNVAELSGTYGSLQQYVNDHMEELTGAYNELESFVNDYFTNLDVQNEINNKLDAMAENGALSDLMYPIIVALTPDIITEWLANNVDPSTNPIVDSSLTISGAASDAQATGVKLRAIPGVALPISTANECLKVTMSGSSTLTFTLSNNWDSGKWYIAFSCSGTTYQISNDTSYAGTRRVIITNNITGTGGKFVIMALVYDTDNTALSFKRLLDCVPTDYVLQLYYAGYNITPWFCVSFADANKKLNTNKTLDAENEAADSKVVGDKIKPIPGVAIPCALNYKSVLKVETTDNGDNTFNYSVTDNQSDKYWYLNFSCGTTQCHVSNNENYSPAHTPYIIFNSSISGGPFNAFKAVVLVLNPVDRSISFKYVQNMGVNDYALVEYVGGSDVTPWFNPNFTPTPSPMPYDQLKYPGNIFMQVGTNIANAVEVTYVTNGNNLTYTLDSAINGNWYEMFAAGGTRYQMSNDPNYTANNLIRFESSTITVVNYIPICIAVDIGGLTISLKRLDQLTVNDAVMCVYFGGKNTTPWVVPFVKGSGSSDSEIKTKSILTSNLYKIFKKVGCIGDSWTAGYLKSLATGTVYGKSEGYSWPDYMKDENRVWINGGYSGATVLTYLTDNTPSNGGGHTAIENAGVCQCYIIGLGINDSNPSVELNVPVGSPSDIGTNASTYYGGLSRIINWARNISSDAFILCCTMYPQTGTLATRYAPYNEAIRNIVSSYNSDKIRLLDLAERGDVFGSVILSEDLINNHYGCVGWATIAGAMQIILDEEIGNNTAIYHDVRQLPVS